MSQRCADMSTGNALLLNSIMSSFRASFVAARAVDLARKIRDMDDVGFPRHLLYCSLGQCVAAADPPDDQKLVLLNEVCCSVFTLTVQMILSSLCCERFNFHRSYVWITCL